MYRLALVCVLFFSLISCSKGLLNGDLNKNLTELDKSYGKCDNPMRQFSKAQKKVCEDKQRAAGPNGTVDEPLNITELIENYKNGGKTVYASSSVNTELWNASLILLDPYTLKIADSQGGIITTDWIMNKDDPLHRCSIKINITSQELVSTGVRVKLICEKKDLEVWYSDNNSYVDEEKNMTIKILKIAQELKDSAAKTSN